MIHLNAFTQCSICPQSKGQWKHPLDRSSTGYRDLEYYAEIALTLQIVLLKKKLKPSTPPSTIHRSNSSAIRR